MSVDEDFAALGFECVDGELEQGGLADAVGAGEPDDGAHGKVGREVVDHRVVVRTGVGEGDMAEGEPFQDIRQDVAGNRRGLRQQFVERIRAFAYGGDIRQQTDDALDGLDRRDEEHLVENHVADRNPALRRQGAGEGEDGDFAEDEKEGEEESETDGKRVRLVVAFLKPLECGLRQIGEPSFRIQQTQQRERHQEIEKGGVRGFALASDAVRVCGETAGKRGEQENREREKRHESDGEGRRSGEEGASRREHHHGGLERSGEESADESADGAGVAGQLGDEFAALESGETGGGHVHHRIEHAELQIGLNAAGTGADETLKQGG